MSYGYWNRVLRVDLSDGRIWAEVPGDDFYRKYFGGRGFIAHYLLTEVPKGIDAFEPGNRLVFAPGVVTGAPVPGAGRHSVGAKSPLTGAFGEAEAGGFWGAELKHAGYDALVIQGRAAHPVYLWINDEEVELRDAGHLWGKITGEVEDAIRAELRDNLVRVAQTGRAGEKMVRYACIVNDLNEFAGRTGLGAVMGAKRLKAIAVRGRRKVPVANPAGLQAAARWVASTLDTVHKAHHELGTGAGMANKQSQGHLIVRNFQDGQMEGLNKIDAAAIRDSYRVKMDGCFACPVRCKKRVRLERPWKVDPRYGGPEYETLGAIGTNLAIDDLAALCKANEILNYYALDSISTGVTISWAIDVFERGLITEADTDGLHLEWANGSLLIRLVEKIANREGFGDLLAEGAVRAARTIGRGTEQYVVHIKGLEVAMHDPRGMLDKRKNYPVTPTGGDHTTGSGLRNSLRNVVGMCIIPKYDDAQMTGIIRDVTGWDLSEEEVTQIVRRGLTMTRLFNLREGLTRADDRLPWRLHQPIATGPLGNYAISEGEIQQAVSDYYAAQGWDPESGVPLPDVLASLGLEQYLS